jgi:hypothetical protein
VETSIGSGEIFLISFARSSSVCDAHVSQVEKEKRRHTTYDTIALNVELPTFKLLFREGRERMYGETGYIRLARQRHFPLPVPKYGDLSLRDVEPEVLQPLGPEAAEERARRESNLIRAGMCGLLGPVPRASAPPNSVSPVGRNEELNTRG